MTAASRALEVLAPGPLTTVQDAGRPGRGALGIGRSGACDRRSYALANRLVGNAEGAAVLEVTLGGLVVRARGELVVVTTGARCAGSWPHLAPTLLPDGAELRLGLPATGTRSYVSVRGGLVVAPVLGSCATDLLAGLGPPPLRAGDVVAIGPPAHDLPGIDVAPVADPAGGLVVLRVLPGPRADWFEAGAQALLRSAAYVVTSDSDRTGLRLDGPVLLRSRTDELPSEGMVRGALQVPPSGRPVLLLADHPVTGGYPVLACVLDDDVDRAAQLRPGQRLRFRPA